MAAATSPSISSGDPLSLGSTGLFRRSLSLLANSPSEHGSFVSSSGVGCVKSVNGSSGCADIRVHERKEKKSAGRTSCHVRLLYNTYLSA
ncbi:MAG: hypothetical protein [Protegovirus mintis]|uniref:Uncharacterized protein n=1 Tax=Cressdnaviricota sp. TaxID=2748378 RepID=A0A345N0W9_9VIRU|nr:MAG: hypothetical protein [Cressdnaviricota sp.]